MQRAFDGWLNWMEVVDGGGGDCCSYMCSNLVLFLLFASPF